MIKKLRRKFIIAAMCAVTAVLSVIIGVIIVTTYLSIAENADEKIAMIIDNGGVFPETPKPHGDIPVRDKHFSPEAFFETRYFTVSLDADGNITATSTGSIFAVSADEAGSMAQNIKKSGRSAGFYGNYRFAVTEIDGGSSVVFLDCFRDLSTLHSFFLSCVLVALVGIIAVFILVMIISRVAVKPIAESYEKQRRFITDASHEIKTPLAIINANADVLEAENGESEWTVSIKNQVERLSTLTQNLIMLSRMEEETTPAMTAVDLSSCVSESVEPFYALAVAGEKTVTTDIDSGIICMGSEPMLRRLISILADNALKYSNDDGDISVTLKKQSKTAVLTVKNTVEQIETGSRDELFGRFVRSDGSRNSQTGGHGIGLSVAYGIVSLHKGNISAFSSDGKSLIITVSLRTKD